MAGLPKIDENVFVERDGVLALARIANEARVLWRETPLHDVGIDGQLEYVDAEGFATGRIVAVQVKAGRSYFAGAGNGPVQFTPAKRHRDYWQDFPIPVIVVLWDPVTRSGVWADARDQLRRNLTAITVAEPLSRDGIRAALASAGPLPLGRQEPAEVVRLMLAVEEPLSRCGLTFLDLFLHGLTDLSAWSVYFSMDLFVDLAHVMQEFVERDAGGLAVAAESYAFIDRYIAFLVAHDLARVDFDAFRRSGEHAGMVGVVLAPLTQRGLELVDFVLACDREVPGDPSAVRERTIQILTDDLPERVARIQLLKTAGKLYG